MRSQLNSQSYTFNLRNTINNEKIGAKLSRKGRKKIKDAIQQVIEWLDGLQLVDSEEYADKLKTLKSICNPIMERIYRLN